MMFARVWRAKVGGKRQHLFTIGQLLKRGTCEAECGYTVARDEVSEPESVDTTVQCTPCLLASGAALRTKTPKPLASAR